MRLHVRINLLDLVEVESVVVIVQLLWGLVGDRRTLEAAMEGCSGNVLYLCLS